ncbi:hypothetical protein HMPREF0496_1182 [Lentilactobacillus hilgardii ATCC 27305]|nr:hypothetical protein HMPREF0496_1182 [Lentilactobacillus hilgardii ATCC 27305]
MISSLLNVYILLLSDKDKNTCSTSIGIATIIQLLRRESC